MSESGEGSNSPTKDLRNIAASAYLLVRAVEGLLRQYPPAESVWSPRTTWTLVHEAVEDTKASLTRYAEASIEEAGCSSQYLRRAEVAEELNKALMESMIPFALMASAYDDSPASQIIAEDGNQSLSVQTLREARYYFPRLLAKSILIGAVEANNTTRSDEIMRADLAAAPVLYDESVVSALQAEVARLERTVERLRERVQIAADQLKREHHPWDSVISGTWTILNDALAASSPDHAGAPEGTDG